MKYSIFFVLVIVFSFPGQGRVRAGSVSWVQAMTPCKESCPAPFAPEQTASSPLGHLLLIPELSKGQVHALGKQLSVFPHLCAHKVVENLGNNYFTFLFFCFLRNFNGYADGNGRAGLDCQPTFRGKFHLSSLSRGGPCF